MPYVLSPALRVDQPGLWGEGAALEATPRFRPDAPNSPPVRADSWRIEPHSLPHLDAPNHIIEGAGDVESLFAPERLAGLWGPCHLLKLRNPVWRELGNGLRHAEVALETLQSEMKRAFGLDSPPEKLLLTLDALPTTAQGLHDPLAALTLSIEAAEWLLSNPRFNGYLTSWKSTDCQPGSKARPIHRLLLPRCAVFECLDARAVPEGRYTLAAFPLRLPNASESPVTPVLFTEQEWAIPQPSR